MKLTPLQVFSSYSLLKSTIRLDDLMQTAIDRGYESIVLTDLNNLYGAAEFFVKAKKYRIKPIIGLTLELNQQETILLAKNTDGYKDLLKISSLKLTDQLNNFDKIKGLLDNLIVISDDQFFLSRNHNTYSFVQVGVKTIKYLDAKDQQLLNVLSAIDDNQVITNPRNLSQISGDDYLPLYKEYFDSLNENQKNIQTKILTSISYWEIDFDKPINLPKIIPDQNSDQLLIDFAKKGLEARLKNKNVDRELYTQRLNYEYKIIKQAGFIDYFLIVFDIVNFANHNNIQIGPGRGSAAGSLIAFALYITQVDPIEFNLLFERFLNPERIAMPDIDIDVSDVDRSKILDYIVKKYGQDKVAQVITFSTLSSRQAVRDVGRIFGLSSADLKTLSNLLPNETKFNLKEAINNIDQNKISSIDTAPHIFEIAEGLEGLPRQFSTHAAGVVISSNNLVDILPVQTGGRNLLTQFTKFYVERLLLKIDILGLSNLGLLSSIIDLIYSSTGKKINPNKINIHDSVTTELFKNADTDYIFQFESSSARNILRKIKVENFEEIVAANALNRPGPNFEDYVLRKNGQQKIDYFDDSLESILKSTYGIIIYQEQAMQIAEVLSGFSLGQADILRSAIGKKDDQKMESLKNQFIIGAEANGHSKQLAQKVFDYIEQFSGYGFNRSHAVAYSKIAFELAYLKINYPVQFFTAILINQIATHDQLVSLIAVMKRYNIVMQAPNINISMTDFSIYKDVIVYGLSFIKNIRTDFAKDIVEQREQFGKYQSLQDFIKRISNKYRKPEIIDPLIYSGALDELGYSRTEMIKNLPMLIEASELGLENLNIDKVEEFSQMQKINFETEYLGIPFSGNPLDQFTTIVEQQKTIKINNLKNNQVGKLLVFINNLKEISTKNNRKMAFIKASDQTGEISLTYFPDIYEGNMSSLTNGSVLLVEGRVEERNGQLNFVVEVSKKIGTIF